MQRKRVGIVVYEEVEVLDFCGPFEVFSVTRMHEEKRRDERSPFLPLLVAESLDVVTATGGLQVISHHSMSECPPLDVLVVPGGWGFRHYMENRCASSVASCTRCSGGDSDRRLHGLASAKFRRATGRRWGNDALAVSRYDARLVP